MIIHIFGMTTERLERSHKDGKEITGELEVSLSLLCVNRVFCNCSGGIFSKAFTALSDRNYRHLFVYFFRKWERH